MSELLRRIAEAFRAWDVKTNTVGDTRARRLTRIVAALRPMLLAADLEAGVELGLSLADLIQAALPAHMLPESREVRDTVAETVVWLLYELLRTRFSLATESETYEAISLLNRWYAPASWPDGVAASLRRVAGVLLEATELLARQGITDDNLFLALVTLVGRDVAIRRTTLIGERIAGLAPDVLRWLRQPAQGRRRVASTNFAEESGLLSADEAIGRLMIDAATFSRETSRIGQDILDSLAIHDPGLVDPAGKLLRGARLLMTSASVVAAARHLVLRNTPGEIVEYLPAEHDLGGMGGARRVRIITPAVIRQIEGLSPQVVLKARVEPIGGSPVN
ncbi:hypothetical protein [Azospirillum humicireducens]|uniref:hypothetical protein n=1 Tax=Azospirillum humicireducens TaxID=1226968 RepID=UPI0011B26C77|nr:hypothetical protein [Azospirillum humicireducens]